MQILQNEIKCLSCGDIIYSKHRHDYVTCSCGKVATDGGMAYLRRRGTGYSERSICIADKTYKELKEAIEWAEETGRNERGLICAFFRVLRDNEYDLDIK